LRAADVDVPQAAVAVVLAPQPDGRPSVLLIRRAERDGDPWSGHMALPGGRRDAADADLLATATRETREEVAVVLERAHLLGELDDLRPLSAPRRILVRPFVFGIASQPRTVASSEVAGLAWAGLDELVASAGSTDVMHLGALRTMPCYRVGADVVWGMTQRILEPFLALYASLR
jgi:8-oxo-dGTP pyrophosphatase MutT (NUDIX family)